MALSYFGRERLGQDVPKNFTADSAKPMPKESIAVSATVLKEPLHTMISKPLTDSGPSHG